MILTETTPLCSTMVAERTGARLLINRNRAEVRARLAAYNHQQPVRIIGGRAHNQTMVVPADRGAIIVTYPPESFDWTRAGVIGSSAGVIGRTSTSDNHTVRWVVDPLIWDSASDWFVGVLERVAIHPEREKSLTQQDRETRGLGWLPRGIPLLYADQLGPDYHRSRTPEEWARDYRSDTWRKGNIRVANESYEHYIRSNMPYPPDDRERDQILDKMANLQEVRNTSQRGLRAARVWIDESAGAWEGDQESATRMAHDEFRRLYLQDAQESRDPATWSRRAGTKLLRDLFDDRELFMRADEPITFEASPTVALDAMKAQYRAVLEAKQEKLPAYPLTKSEPTHNRRNENP